MKKDFFYSYTNEKKQSELSLKVTVLAAAITVLLAVQIFSPMNISASVFTESGGRKPVFW